MAAPKVYKSTDANAPVLSGQVGSLIALLDAVLVNGYGSKTSLGWPKEISGPDKAVYRPALGDDRMLYRIFDNGGGGRFAYLSMYESMSDIDTGSGIVTGDGYEGSSGASVIAKSYTADTVPRSWVVIGDSYGFWFYVIDGRTTYGRSTHTLPHYIGQPIDSLGVGNSAMILSCVYSAATLAVPDSSMTTTGYATRVCKVHRSINASELGTKLHFGIGNSIPIRQVTMPVNEYPYKGQAILSGDVFMTSDDNTNLPRLKMPGLKVGAHSSIGLTPFQMLPDSTLLSVHPALADSSFGGTETNYKKFWAIDIGEGYR